MFLKLPAAILLPVILIYLLYWSTALPNKTPNGFDRIFIDHTASPLHTSQLPVEARRIAGVIDDTVYIETDNPSRLLIGKLTLAHWHPYKINTAATGLIPVDYTFRTKILNGQLHIVSGNQSAITRVHIHRKTVSYIDSLGPTFIYAVPISSHDYILRQFADDLKSLRFVKLSGATKSRRPAKELPIAGQADWLATDGTLLYDADTRILAYAHYYSNKVISFDTALNLIKRFRTIDHTPLPDYDMNKRPKQMIIQTACTYRGSLFLASNLKADNESRQAYLRHIPIDQYDLITGKYLGSFYLPTPGGSLIKSIAVASDTLIVLYHSNRISTFQLPVSS